jgi:hypothetical protein
MGGLSGLRSQRPQVRILPGAPSATARKKARRAKTRWRVNACGTPSERDCDFGVVLNSDFRMQIVMQAPKGM